MKHIETIVELERKLTDEQELVAALTKRAERAEARAATVSDVWIREGLATGSLTTVNKESLEKFIAELKQARERISQLEAALAAGVKALREALVKLWKHTAKIDNGYCAVCRVGYRSYDTKGDVAGKCSDDRCLSHVVEAALRDSTTETIAKEKQ